MWRGLKYCSSTKQFAMSLVNLYWLKMVPPTFFFSLSDVLGMETWYTLWLVWNTYNHSSCHFPEHQKKGRLAHRQNVGKGLYCLTNGKHGQCLCTKFKLLPLNSCEFPKPLKKKFINSMWELTILLWRAHSILQLVKETLPNWPKYCLATYLVNFSWAQICTQVDPSFSLFDHPVQVEQSQISFSPNASLSD